MPRVFNKRFEDPIDAVYVGRPSEFGNPFVIGRDGTRDEVVDKYRGWLMGQPELVEKAKQQLAGKNLVCWCAPARCHADVLLEIANHRETT
jgi:hypothetical protein